MSLLSQFDASRRGKKWLKFSRDKNKSTSRRGGRGEEPAISGAGPELRPGREKEKGKVRRK